MTILPNILQKNMDSREAATHCMLDFETFGNTSNSAIVTIGAVSFARDTHKDNMGLFYARVNVQDCINHGMEMNASTVQWWLKQSAEARAEVAQEDGIALLEAIELFSKWYADNQCENLWGNGATFDNVIIDNAVNKLNAKGHAIKPSWSYRHHQCFRTMRKRFPGHKTPGDASMIAHNALSDALVQALELQNIFRSLNIH